MYIYYIQEEHYKLAESNGISSSVVNSRVRELGWQIERACNEPINNKIKQILTPDINKSLKNNGITINAFWKRLKLGWNIEDAYTIKLYSRKEAMLKANSSRRRITEEQYLLAEKKGINRNTFRQRISRGWGLDNALNTPLFKKGDSRESHNYTFRKTRISK